MKSELSAPHLQNEEAAFEYVEALLRPNGPVWPHCGATEEHIGRLEGKTSRIGMRKCYACRETFTVRMGSIFESSQLKLHLWPQAIYMLSSSKKGISTRQLQRTLGVGLKTAWFLTHRTREGMTDGDLSTFGSTGGAVEVDETFIGRKKGATVGYEPRRVCRRPFRLRHAAMAG
jgi:transposase-like protein